VPWPISSRIPPSTTSALVAILPPGAFLGLGFLIALKNVIDKRAAHRPEAVPAAPPEPAKAG
jgi:electron transport complex protein RnfE